MSSEVLPNVGSAPKEHEREDVPPPEPKKSARKGKILYMPGAKEAQRKRLEDHTRLDAVRMVEECE